MLLKVEQQLGQILLTELLAYQIAKPVQWIDTQELLIEQHDVDRVVEIGPSGTLISMAKKTIASSYPMKEAARLEHPRQLLQYEKDRAQIYFDHEDQEEEPTSAKQLSVAPVQTTATAPPTEPVEDTSIRTQAALPMQDSPLTPSEIVTTVIAQKLRKHFGQVPQDQTIKQLAGGRSVVENEVIGDLHNIFPGLPEKAEDITLTELHQQIAKTNPSAAQLSKSSAKLTSRLISAKMPAGFNLAGAGQHMKCRWGLGDARQQAVLLVASTQQPPSRLETVEVAKSFLDEVVREYAQPLGINIDIATETSHPAGDMARTETRQLRDSSDGTVGEKVSQHDSMVADLALSRELRNEAAAHKSVAANLQDDLDSLSRELGSQFIDGVRPIMSKHKARVYNSSWNWVMQDLHLMLYSVLQGDARVTDISVRQRCSQMLRQSTKPFARVVKHFQSSTTNAGIAKLMQELLDNLDGSSTSLRTSPFSPREMMAPHTFVDTQGRTQTAEIERPMNELEHHSEMRTRTTSGWSHNKRLTSLFERQLATYLLQGHISFKNKAVLVTGAGRGSIGSDIVRGLIAGGAQVVVTTSHRSTNVYKNYRELYMAYGATGSELVVVPFNQGSRQDVESLVKYIYHDLEWDLDHIVPFAAVAEEAEIDNIGPESELAHRLMLINVIRLLGAVAKEKQDTAKRTSCGPVQVILPLSPNHGTFGRDGLYSESKVGLEMLMSKWHSESWRSYVSVCGAIIGWTRGTGLMSRSGAFAAGMEQHGIRTFTTAEMASRLLILMSEPLAWENELEPIYADFSGGMDSLPDLREKIDQVRLMVREKSDIGLALKKEGDAARGANEDVGDGIPQLSEASKQVSRLANMDVSFPKLVRSSVDTLPSRPIDLDQVVVVTGMGEVGPHGSSRTRWEMEAEGKLSLEGCLELAWVMGLIKHHVGNLPNGKYYIGWVDSKTGNPVPDSEMKARFEQHILEHIGIRFVNPEMDHGYNPHRKQYLQEVVLEVDMPAFTTSKEMAEHFRLEHGDKADITDKDANECYISLRKGAVLMVPKAVPFSCDIAGQIPSGWDARQYGFPDWIIAQVDRATLFALVATVEALISSGIVDPYELYQHIHVSEVGNCIGSALGGMRALREVFGLRNLDKDIKNDALQETFINTTSAWINMLLLSASGPIRTPVAACATSIESLELGYETILSGKARFCLVGGVDDTSEVTAFEFASMKATVNTDEEKRKGRTPSEASRPTTSSRAGFVESHGAGIQVITSARLALDMGLPIRAIVAAVNTVGDKVGRSVPAPGRGLLANTHRLAPALAAWGLSVDHLDVASLHGTSTPANDINETTIIHQQLSHMGRDPGNPIMAVCQKYLTGHSKGGAGAWMVNGGLQILETGIVPGNRNADNIDIALKKNDLLFFPNQAVRTAGVNALSVTSFGFGQKNAQAILVHPRHLLAALPKEVFEAYVKRASLRQKKASQAFQKGLVMGNLFSAKDRAPYDSAQEKDFLLSPAARVSRRG